MEWVETTGKTVDAAREVALDQLGVAVDEAEIEIVEEPKAGLFGRTRGEARVRARIKPTPVRAKQDRRRRSRGKSGGSGGSGGAGNGRGRSTTAEAGADAVGQQRAQKGRGSDENENGSSTRGSESSEQEQTMSTTEGSNDDGARRDDRGAVSPQEVGEAAVAFMDGLTAAFGISSSSTLTVEGTELDVAVTGEGLGLLVGSGGRTLNAIQDLARVAAQRRLGDHETRLRIDVAGYRERRQAALARFAQDVAEEVRTSGSARAMEPMNSADRKVIHDVLNEESGVESRSEGEDPNRRIIVLPAE